MEHKILGFQFEPVSAKRTRPSYNDRSDQDEPETHHNRLGSQEWCNCQKCEKMPTELECVCCYEVPKVKAFHLKGKARLSWNTAALEFTELVLFRCFSKYMFLKISLYSLESTCVGVAFLKRCFLESLFFNFIKKRPRRSCFSVNTAKFLRTAFFRIPLVTASEFLTKLPKNYCEANHFSVELFSEIFLVNIS